MGMKIGIIGGSGLQNQNIIENYKEIEVDTPFGKPSSKLITGKIGSVDVVIIKRHGAKDEIPPTYINNKANIFALKYEGCKYILATTAVGSLREEIKRGDFVVLDDLIDFTRRRDLTFYEKFEFGSLHAQMATPFSEVLRKKLIAACEELKFPHHNKGTVVTIEGSRFSTRAESKMFRQWGADIINMTTGPEAIFANEAEVPYGQIAMVTDYDCWKSDEEVVSKDMIGDVMKANVERVKQVLLKVVESFSREQEIIKLKEKIRTIPNFPTQGVMFRDITTLLKDRESLRKLVNILYEKYKDTPIDLIAAVESRGFTIAGILAEKLNTGLVLIRKPGKLPAETLSESYNLEYGTDSVEIHRDAISAGQRVLVIDDLIATGGTALASCQLINRLGGQVESCATVIELEELGGRQKLTEKGYNLFSVMKFKENEQ
jgi:5'-methylthioadenosine phosphorylase